jgi:hypothetical protein
MTLTAQQWRFLALRLVSKTDTEAARELGIAENTPANWKGNDPEFAREYEACFRDGVHVAQEIARRNLGRAADTLCSALGATTTSGQPNWRARLEAARLLLQTHGLLRDRQELSGPGGGPIQHKMNEPLDLTRLSDAELAALERLVERAEDQSRADPDRAS